MGTLWSNDTNTKSIQIYVFGGYSVGKSTICKSISLSYHQDKNEHMQNQIKYNNKISEIDMIEQARKNCANQMHWMLNHRFSYGYWEIPSQDSSKDSEEMKQDIEFINKYRIDKFSSMWNYQISKYGATISRLWNYKYLNNLYRTRVTVLPGTSIVSEGRDGKYWLDEMDYWFDKILTIMTTSYNYNTLSIDDYLHIHNRSDWNKIQKYSFTIDNTAYQLNDVGGLWSNWTFTPFPKCDCILYVAALNQYAHGRQDWCNSLMECFNDIKSVKEKYADPTNVKMIVLLNKCDLFKTFLYHKSFNSFYWMEEEYKGRNYDDYDDGVCAKIMQRICSELVMIDDVVLEVSRDIAGIMLKYCHLKIDSWLELVCDDGIEFMKQKMLKIGPNIEDVYVTNAIDIHHMKSVMDEIQTMLQTK